MILFRKYMYEIVVIISTTVIAVINSISSLNGDFFDLYEKCFEGFS